MTPLNLTTLVLMGLLFVVWAVAMFVVLFGIARRAGDRHRAAGTGYFSRIGHSLAMYGDFLRAPEHRRARLRLLGLTFLLMASILLRITLIG